MMLWTAPTPRHQSAKGWSREANHIEMGEVSTIGLDIAKSVFQVHGVDGTGAVVMRKRIGRAKVLEFFGGLPPAGSNGHATKLAGKVDLIFTSAPFPLVR